MGRIPILTFKQRKLREEHEKVKKLLEKKFKKSEGR